jgi:hypothetical protein
MTVWASELRCCPSSSLDAQLDPKNAYIKNPLGDRDTRRRKNTKHINRGCSSEYWRGNAVGVALGRFSTLSDINTIITAMKRE